MTIVIIGHEANILTLRLLSHRQATLASKITHFILRQLTQRKENAGQLFLVQRVQEVGLIFGDILSPKQLITSIDAAHTSVMPRGQEVRPPSQRPFEEQAEADSAIAANAWVGRTTNAILGDEVIHHMVFESRLDVNEMKRDMELVCNTPSTGNRIRRTATIRGRVPPRFLGPQPQHDTDDLVPTINQKCSRDSAIDPAAESNESPSRITW
jgi:hypothetical protein